MTSYRKTALAGGILYLLTFLGSIPAAILVGPAMVPGYITSAGSDQVVALGAVLELVNVICCFGCAIALFSVIRRVHEGLAVGYLATRLFEAATITIAVVSILSITTLHQQATATGNAEALSPIAATLVAIRNWAMTIGPNMAAFNALMLGTALYRARLVPRWIPALGIVGAPILIAYVIASILGFHVSGTILQVVAVFPFFTWELVLGLWLTFKGFSNSSTVAVEERDAVAPSLMTAKAGAA